MHTHGSFPRIIAVIGPTASGKTELGAALGVRFGGEIVSADAKQVYRRMDIGTAKEKDLPVAQHLIDIREPGERITVGQYQALAYECIDRLLEHDILPIMVGGSGLYAESVLRGYLFEGGPGSKASAQKYDSLKLGIAWEREALIARAEQRLEIRLKAGLIEEVEGLIAEGVSPEWLISCGIEYRYITEYLHGELSLEEASERIIIATRQFIKRQYTWWRRHDDIVWVKGFEEAEPLVKKFVDR